MAFDVEFCTYSELQVESHSARMEIRFAADFLRFKRAARSAFDFLTVAKGF